MATVAASTSFAQSPIGMLTPSDPQRRKKKPYKELTLEEKVQLIRLAEENAGMSQASIAERYAIAKSNVCRILQRKQEYIRAYESAGFAGSRKRKLRSDDALLPPTSNCSNSSSTPAAIPRISRPQPRIATAVTVEQHHHHHFGNETLRAHMYKQHQISRMFMCRCCNWAFPDKTSLHMHMQAKEEGKSINVPVIGKGGAQGTQPGGPLHTPQPQNAFSPLQLHPLLPPHQPLSIADPSAGNIFPLSMVQQREDLMNKLRERFVLNSMVAQSGFNLAAWLANFPKVDASGVGRLGGSLNLRPEEDHNEDQKSEEGECDVDMKMNDSPVIVEETHQEQHNGSGEDSGDDPVNIADDDDHHHRDHHRPLIKGEEDVGCEKANSSDSPVGSCSSPDNGSSPNSSHMPALRSAINASPLNSLMYKKRLLDNNNSCNSRRKNLQEALLNIAEHASSNSHHPTAHHLHHGNNERDATAHHLHHGNNDRDPTAHHHHHGNNDRDVNHVSPSETHSSVSPPSEPGNCYECGVVKGKLAVSENRCRYLESRTATLQTDALRFSTRVSVSENNSRQFEQETRILREQNEILQRKLLECQEKTLAFMQAGEQQLNNNSKALNAFLNDVLQTTFFR